MMMIDDDDENKVRSGQMRNAPLLLLCAINDYYDIIALRMKFGGAAVFL